MSWNVKSNNGISLWQKPYLSIDEASFYFDIDKNIIKSIISQHNNKSDLAIESGSQILLKRIKLEDYLIDKGYLIYKAGKMESTCLKSEITQMGLYAYRSEMPWYEKPYLTIDEASEYFRIGRGKIRELVKLEEEAKGEDCNYYILKNGNKTLIRKRKLEEYLDRCYQI